MEVSIIWTAASWAAASASMMRPRHQPAGSGRNGYSKSCKAKMIRQIAPRSPGSQDPEDAVEDTSVVYPRNATRLIRQHGLDGKPFIVGEFVAHDSSTKYGSSIMGVRANATSWLAMVGRFQVKADISHTTTPAEIFENDRFC